MNKFKLAIATPFYSVTAFAPYIVSLLDAVRALDEMGVEWDYWQICGDSYVDRAKNSLVHKFLKSDFTHLFMVDSDEAWDVVGFCRVVKAAMLGCEVVGALYPCKNNWEFYGGIPKMREDGFMSGIERDGMRLIEMDCIPGGFLIYSREAFERARPKLNSYIAPEDGESVLEAFRCNIEPHGGRIGEDIYFQKRYQEMGGRVFCEPDVSISHFGVKAWDGNYHEFLLKRKEEWLAEQSLGLTADDTKALLQSLAKNDKAMQALDDLA